MSYVTRQKSDRNNKAELQIQLVGFKRESAEQIEAHLPFEHLRVRWRRFASPATVGNLRSSLWVVEMKPPTTASRSIGKSYHIGQFRLWTRQLKGYSPLLVVPWLNPSRVADHILVDLLETGGATLFWGHTYRKGLLEYLYKCSKRDLSRILTNVSVTDAGVTVTFADGKHANINLTEFKRLAESHEISWDNIRISNSRDYLEVGIPTGQEVPVPSDIIREFIAEERDKRKGENQILRNTTAGVLGKRVRRLRERQQMTQEGLADRAQVSRWTVIRLESGKHLPRVSALERIAVALGTSLSSFLSP